MIVGCFGCRFWKGASGYIRQRDGVCGNPFQGIEDDSEPVECPMWESTEYD